MDRSGSSLHAALQPQVSAKYEPIQTHNALNYILDLLDDPGNHLDHAKRCVLLCPAHAQATRLTAPDPPGTLRV